jgi:uncharacterized membrane protein YuzA (DUF378 family)
MSLERRIVLLQKESVMTEASTTAAVLSVKGSINWGFVGMSEYNLVETWLPPAVERTVYVLAGVSGLAFVMPSLGPCFSDDSKRVVN